VHKIIKEMLMKGVFVMKFYLLFILLLGINISFAQEATCYSLSKKGQLKSKVQKKGCRGNWKATQEEAITVAAQKCSTAKNKEWNTQNLKCEKVRENTSESDCKKLQQLDSDDIGQDIKKELGLAIESKNCDKKVLKELKKKIKQQKQIDKKFNKNCEIVLKAISNGAEKKLEWLNATKEKKCTKEMADEASCLAKKKTWLADKNGKFVCMSDKKAEKSSTTKIEKKDIRAIVKECKQQADGNVNCSALKKKLKKVRLSKDQFDRCHQVKAEIMKARGITLHDKLLLSEVELLRNNGCLPK
jgi:hypothetical protein